MDLPEDLGALDPEQVLAFLHDASEVEIARSVRGYGTQRVLQALFDAMAGRVRPDPGRRVGELAFVLSHGGTRHEHRLLLTPQGATHVTGATRARATLSTDVVSFLRVAAGAADPKRLLLRRRLSLGGDVLWAVGVLAGLRA